MTGRVEVERKVRQLDNDVQAIYGMLTTIDATQKQHSDRLNEIAATQADHGRKLDDHGQQLATHGQKLDAQAQQLATHGQKLDAQGQKLDAILDLLRGNQAP